MKKTITFDMDEVLAESIRAIVNQKQNPFGIPFEKISNYNIHEIPGSGIQLEEAIQIFDSFFEQNQDKIAPIPGMQETIQQISFQGYKIFIITARPEKLKDITIKRVEKHYPGIFQDIFFTNHFHGNKICKGDVCKKLGSSLMIEDSPHHGLAISQQDIPVLLLDKPRNQEHNPDSHPLITKIYHPNDILSHLP